MAIRLPARLARAAAGTAAALALAAAPFAARASRLLTNLNDSANVFATAVDIKTKKSLPELIGSYIGAALGLLGVVLVVIVIYAGFLWMTAQGSEEKVKTAKKLIQNAVIGMIIVFATGAITTFVVNALTSSVYTSQEQRPLDAENPYAQ